MEHKVIEHWGELFPIIGIDGEPKYYMDVEQDGDGYKVVCHKFEFDLVYDKYSIEKAVLSALDNFHTEYVHSINETVLQRHRVNIARQTRRGIANHRFGDTWYYRGHMDSNPGLYTDSPAIIGKTPSGDYGLFIHPKFKLYGFTIKERS